jgi:hypothetical protein
VTLDMTPLDAHLPKIEALLYDNDSKMNHVALLDCL